MVLLGTCLKKMKVNSTHVLRRSWPGDVQGSPRGFLVGRHWFRHGLVETTHRDGGSQVSRVDTTSGGSGALHWRGGPSQANQIWHKTDFQPNTAYIISEKFIPTVGSVDQNFRILNIWKSVAWHFHFHMIYSTEPQKIPGLHIEPGNRKILKTGKYIYSMTLTVSLSVTFTANSPVNFLVMRSCYLSYLGGSCGGGRSGGRAEACVEVAAWSKAVKLLSWDAAAAVASGSKLGSLLTVRATWGPAETGTRKNTVIKLSNM